MSKSTISTFELFEMFPDQETARVYLEHGRKAPNVRYAVWASGSRPARTASIVATNAKKTLRCALARYSSARIFRCTNGFMRCICFSQPARVSQACNCRKRLASGRHRHGSCYIASGKRAGQTSKSFAVLSKLTNVSSAVSRPTSMNTEAQGRPWHSRQDRSSRDTRTWRPDCRQDNCEHGRRNGPGRNLSACGNRLDLAYRRSRGIYWHRRQVFRS